MLRRSLTSAGQKYSTTTFVTGAVLLCLLVLGLTTYNLWRLRAVAIENGLSSSTQFASAIEEHLTQTLNVVDVSLVNLAEQDAPEATMQTIMRNARYIRSVSIVDAHGRIKVSSEPRNVGLIFDGHALLPQATEPLPLLRMGPLMAGRDLFNARPIPADQDVPPQTLITVQRHVPLNGNKFANMVAVINPDYFLNYYGRHLDLNFSEIELLRPDGSLLLSTAQNFIPGHKHNEDVTQRLEAAESGRLTQSTSTGLEWLTAYRASRHFPAIVVVHLNKQHLLAAWTTEAMVTLSVVLGLMALTLASSGVYFLRSLRLAFERDIWVKDLNNQKYALDQHAIVSMSDLSGCITYANDRFCAISAYAREELIGQPHSLIKSGLHDTAFYQQLWQTIQNGQVWHGEICSRKKTGELYWVHASIVPLMGLDGQVQQYIAIRTDITDRKHIERSLEEAKEIAEKASLAKSQFLANMSHEIRTPMNAVLGLLQLLQGSVLTPAQKTLVTQTETSARFLLSLLNDILDFSKVEAGMMTLEVLPFRLDTMVDELANMLASSVGEKPIDLNMVLDPDVPPMLIGDDMRLRQILLNLGSNAIKFTDHGQVLVRIQKVPSTGSETLVKFSVQDSGIGIAAEHQQSIFEGFSQAESSTTRRYGGSGLGLSICRQLVEMMGGQLQVESSLGKGSTFFFTISLPVAPAPTTAISASALQTETRTQRLQGMHLLVVEDNAVNQMVAQQLLTREGAIVSLAENGALGMQLAITAQPGFDAILMDIQMPVMDGYEAARAIRAHMGAQCPPIIAMTANTMVPDRLACLEAGMQDHIGKPILLDRLVLSLHEATGQASGMRQPA